MESSCFVDAYETVLMGVPNAYIFSLLENGYLSDSTVFFEVTGMQQGLPWPRIAWELISFKGTVRAPEVANITYVNQAIPPPYRACIHLLSSSNVGISINRCINWVLYIAYSSVASCKPFLWASAINALEGIR